MKLAKQVVSSVIGASLLFSSSLFVQAETGNVKKASVQAKEAGEKQASVKAAKLPAGATLKLKPFTTLMNTTRAKYKKDEIIVKFKKGGQTASVKNLTKANTKLGLRHVQTLGKGGVELMKVKPGTPLSAALKAVRSSGLVQYAEPNYMMHPMAVSDPYYSYQWGLKNTGQNISGYGTAGMDINVESAWTKTKGSASVVVAVIDTGVDLNHPDLKPRMWKNTKETAGDFIDNDGNGYVDDVDGWDFYYEDNSVYDSYTYDEHGTHVSGIIAGNADSSGIIGVAPGVKIMPLKAFGPNGGYTSDEIKAINYAKAQGAKIINASWGGYSYSQSLYEAIRDSGALFVAAAGNESNNNDATPAYPASYDLSNIISVAAVTNTGDMASFSNYGATTVDIGAPGYNIVSTIPTAAGSYNYMSGTSMAAPMVTGVAALLLSAKPTATMSQLKSALLNTKKPLSSLSGKTVTGGMVDAGAAMKSIAPTDDDVPGKALGGATTTVKGTLNASSDVDDVYAIKLQKGEVLTVATSGTSGTDFDLYLYDGAVKTVKSSLGIVAYSEKAGTSREKLTYIATKNGTFYLNMSAYKGKGSYNMYIRYGMGKGTYEDNSFYITHNGTWHTLANSYVSGKKLQYTNAQGANMTFTFTGTGLALIGMKSPSQGIAEVTIDGKKYNANLYYSRTINQTTLLKVTGLAYGRHTVVIKWTGKRGSSAARKAATGVNIDRVIVY